MAKDTFTCFHCKEPVLKVEAKKDSAEQSGKIVNKYFHDNCFDEFTHNKQERKELNAVCDYIKDELLRYTEKQRVPKHLVRRIQALKSGQEYSATKNSKVYGNANGYSYEVILKTVKAMKFPIIDGIDRTTFKNDTHLIDYIMVIIINNINDIMNRMEAKKDSDKRLDHIKIDIDEGSRFNHTKINENKIAKKLSDMW